MLSEEMFQYDNVPYEELFVPRMESFLPLQELGIASVCEMS